jgi:hypothetical protein
MGTETKGVNEVIIDSLFYKNIVLGHIFNIIVEI